jgi:hypothetical protein
MAHKSIPGAARDIVEEQTSAIAAYFVYGNKLWCSRYMEALR